MDYRTIYNQLITRAQIRSAGLSRYLAKKKLGYIERHHIIPRCMGGTEDASNIAFLTAREHLISHILLTKLYPENFKLRRACERLLYDRQGNKLNGRSYDWLKRSIAAFMRTQNKHNNLSIAQQAQTLTGRTKEEYEYLQLLSDKRTGLNKHNCEFMAKIAETLRGRTKETHSSIAAQAEKMRGRTAATHSGIALNAENRNKLTHEQRVQVVQMKDEQGFNLKQIHQHFLSLGLTIHYTTIHQLYHRQKVKLSKQ